MSDETLTQPPPESTCPVDSAMLLTAFALTAAMCIVPLSWQQPMALGGVVLFIIALEALDPEKVSLTLFCTVFLAVAALNPWHVWPVPLLLPLAVYGVLAALIPSLRRPLAGLVWGKFDAVTIALMFVTIVGSTAGLLLWYWLARPNVDDVRAMVPAMPAWLLPLAGLGFAVVNALIEETIWRGILWRLLSRTVRAPWAVIVLQAGSFGLVHIGGFPRGWSGVALASLYGLFLGLMRHRARGLGPVIVAHIVADITIFAIVVLTI